MRARHGRASPAGVRRREADRFMELVRTHDDHLRRLASRMLADPGRTDDVLQEVYIRAFRSWDRFRGDADLGTWLHRITYNCCVDELRAAARRPRPVAAPPDRPSAGSELGHRVAVQDAVRAALQTLPVDQRAAVLLVDGARFDHRAAAAVLGVPTGTVASRVARARKVLRAALALDKENLDDR